MQRISDPQIVDAFTRSSTSPCPGAGTGTLRICTVESPGKNAAIMLLLAAPVSFAGSDSFKDFASPTVLHSNHARQFNIINPAGCPIHSAHSAEWVGNHKPRPASQLANSPTS